MGVSGRSTSVVVRPVARLGPDGQPVTAAAATPTPVNNESAGAEGAEFIAQDLSQDPPGNDDLLPRPAGGWASGLLARRAPRPEAFRPAAFPGSGVVVRPRLVADRRGESTSVAARGESAVGRGT